MAVQISPEQIGEQLEMMGFEAPDFAVAAALSVVDSIDGCLDKAGYTDAVMTLIKVYPSSSSCLRLMSVKLHQNMHRPVLQFRTSILLTAENRC